MLLLARTTPARAVKQEDRRPVGVPGRHPGVPRQGHGDPASSPAMINHNTTEVFFDGARVPAANLIGEEGKGFRYILDGMNAERILVSAEAIGDARWFTRDRSGLRQRARRLRPADRPEPGRAVPDRARLRRDRGCRPDAAQGGGAVRRRPPCGDDANMAKLLASEAAWHAAEACLQTPRRLRLRAGVRRRAQVARDRASSRSRRSRPTWCWPTSPSTCSGMPRSY